MSVRSLIFALSLLTALGCSRSEPTMPTSGSSDVSRETDVVPPASAKTPTDVSDYAFAAPVRLDAEGEFISVETPGYACPTVADIDQDGKLELVVGQFSGGSMQLFENEAEPTEPPRLIAAGWIQSGGERAIVPGVW